ncbi:MAG: Lon-like ATP-dependent protease, partial [Natronomonas sp.]
MSNEKDEDAGADERRTPTEEPGEEAPRDPPEEPIAPAQEGANEQLDEDEELLDGSDLGSDVEVEGDIEIDEDEEDSLLGGLQIDSSEDIAVPDRLVDQVIGQDHARDIVLKAAKQRRHVMMIGSPGTGKSMLAKAMSQLLPKEELQDVLVYHNPDDGNEPKVRTVPAGKGEQIVDAHKEEARKRNQMRSFLMWIIIAVVFGYAILIAQQLLLGIIAAGIIYLAFKYMSRGSDAMVPNLLVNNADQQVAPFEDA